MQFDYAIFTAINGLAGHYAWLDALGRVVAVYGLLVALLAAVALAWWPRGNDARGKPYIVGLLAAGALCALMIGLETLCARYLLHHDFRQRPVSHLWTTLLVVEGSYLSFPAWPAAIAVALALPAYGAWRRAGLTLAVFAVGIGLSLIFVGGNYPLDVVAGWFLGVVIGVTALALARLPWRVDHAPGWRLVGALWLTLGLAAVGAVLLIRAARADEAEGGSADLAAQYTLAIPPAVQAAVRQAGLPGEALLLAATNGRLLVGELDVTLPSPDIPLPAVEAVACREANAAFSTWDKLGLLTLTISSRFPGGNVEKMGTLYTASVAREEWPVGGYSLNHPLRSKKFFHQEFFRPHARTGAR